MSLERDILERPEVAAIPTAELIQEHLFQAVMGPVVDAVAFADVLDGDGGGSHGMLRL